MKRRLKVDSPGRELWSRTVPGVCSTSEKIWYGRGCQGTMHPLSSSNYLVTVRAMVVVCVVAVTPLLDCAEMVRL